MPTYYDEILMAGLKLAQADAARGLLDDERMQHIRDAVSEIIDDLATHKDEVVAAPESEEGDAPSPLARLEQAEAETGEQALPERWRQGKPVLCIPGPKPARRGCRRNGGATHRTAGDWRAGGAG